MQFILRHWESINFYGFITVSDTVLAMGDMEGDSK